MPPSTWPPSLAFLGDCDGPADTFLADLARRAGDGLRRIFGHCGVAPDDDLLLWMTRHDRPSGGDLRQLDRPHRAADPRGAGPPPGAGRPPAGRRRQRGAAEEPLALRNRLVGFVEAERQAGRLTLSTPGRTPISWRVRNGLDLGRPCRSPSRRSRRSWWSRRRCWRSGSGRWRRRIPSSTTAPAPNASRGSRRWRTTTSRTSSRSSGSVKPGPFRRRTLSLLLRILDYSMRHIYNRGHLARVQYDPLRPLGLPGRQAGACSSPATTTAASRATWTTSSTRSPGGSTSSSATAWLPATDYLIKRGARNEQQYKRTLRRHQLPTRGLVQGLSRPHGRRSGDEHPDPRGPRAAGHDRRARRGNG